MSTTIESFPFQQLPLMIQKDILADLDENEFINICSLQEMNYLCSGNNDDSNYIYIQRMKNKFPNLFEVSLKFLDPNIEALTWKQLYERLLNFNRVINEIGSTLVPYLINNNLLMELKIFYEIVDEKKFQKYFQERFLSIAIRENKPDIFKWLLSDEGPAFEIDYVNDILRKGLTKFLDILKESGYKISMDLYTSALDNKDSLDWLAQNQGSFNFIFGNFIDHAIRWESINYIEWLNSKNYLDDYQKNRIIEDALYMGSIKILDYMYNRFNTLPKQSFVDRKINKNPLILEWLKNHGLQI